MNAHFIEQENILVAFFPETKRFFRINEKAKELIEAMLGNSTQETIMKQFGINCEVYQKYFTYIHNDLFSDNYMSESNQKNENKTLSRLVIHLTNDCNMRCKYCYANGGNYNSTRDYMTVETFDKMFNVFFQQFNAIRSIQFFGGEPLMNIALLEYACKKIKTIGIERNHPINMGIVTNGTLIDDNFIDLVNKYHLQVTLSYDGNPMVNDIMRVMNDGGNSSSIILKKAKLLKEKTGQPNTVEVTYNQNHVINSVSIIDVVNHIREELQNTHVHLVPAGGSETSDYAVNDLRIFTDSVKQIIEKGKTLGWNNDIPSYSLADRIFFALKNKNANIPHICDAGIGTLSVSTKGNVYPCFMFTDNEDMCYGNINDDSLFDSTQSKMLQNRLMKFSTKESNVDCKHCFIKKLCNGCLGLNSFHSGNPFKLSPKICDMFRSMTEQALIEYTLLFEKESNERSGA